MRMKYNSIACPICGKKGLGFPGHEHARGYKDYERVRCRYCDKTFNRDKLDAYLDKIEEGIKNIAEAKI